MRASGTEDRLGVGTSLSHFSADVVVIATAVEFLLLSTRLAPYDTGL